MDCSEEVFQLRPAAISDVPAIADLVEPYVVRRILLRRSVEELRDLCRNGFVAEIDGKMIGFAAVEIYSLKLAELQCLVVAAAYQSRGVGRRLVEACVECAKEHQVVELMAITSADGFFQECGFHYSLPDQRKAFFLETCPRS
jgi:amino-acid N-acetyltransferase